MFRLFILVEMSTLLKTMYTSWQQKQKLSENVMNVALLSLSIMVVLVLYPFFSGTGIPLSPLYCKQQVK